MLWTTSTCSKTHNQDKSLLINQHCLLNVTFRTNRPKKNWILYFLNSFQIKKSLSSTWISPRRDRPIQCGICISVTTVTLRCSWDLGDLETRFNRLRQAVNSPYSARRPRVVVEALDHRFQQPCSDFDGDIGTNQGHSSQKHLPACRYVNDLF
jgi:hypothetical protein